MNKEQFKILVLQKGATYYFSTRENYYESKWYNKYKFDGYVAEDTYNNNWCKLLFLPKKITEIILGKQELVKYILKDDYKDLESLKVPEEVLPEFFEYGEDQEEQNHADIASLYNPIYESTPETEKEIEFTLDIIDLDAAPIEKTKYTFESEFPYKIDIHPDILYKYPCHITGTQLFSEIRTAVNENLTSNCRIEYNYDDYLKVNLIIPVIHEETEVKTTVNIFSRKKKDKTKTEIKPLRAINFPIIDISSPKDTIWKKTRIEAIYADNYFELEKKIDTIINNYLDSMNQKLVVCSHCKGYGFIKEK